MSTTCLPSMFLTTCPGDIKSFWFGMGGARELKRFLCREFGWLALDFVTIGCLGFSTLYGSSFKFWIWGIYSGNGEGFGSFIESKSWLTWWSLLSPLDCWIRFMMSLITFGVMRPCLWSKKSCCSFPWGSNEFWSKFSSPLNNCSLFRWSEYSKLKF